MSSVTGAEIKVEPHQEWDVTAIRKSLDELFTITTRYKSTKAYRDLLEFIRRFRAYSPFNAMLAHIQRPGATYVAPPHRWLAEYRRHIKAGANPIVMLQPMGPVMFVFDVSDTEPEKDAPRLPPEIERPFEVRRGYVGSEYDRTIENAKRDGVAVLECDAGSQHAGSIRCAKEGKNLLFQVKTKPEPLYISVPLRFEMLLNKKQSMTAKYATLAHELGHLYCGHLGTPDEKWWPDRRGCDHEVQEFEAESVCYLICERLGIENPSAQYLSNFSKRNEDGNVPQISLERVMASAGLIEQMGRERLHPRKLPSTKRS